MAGGWDVCALFNEAESTNARTPLRADRNHLCTIFDPTSRGSDAFVNTLLGELCAIVQVQTVPYTIHDFRVSVARVRVRARLPG